MGPGLDCFEGFLVIVGALVVCWLGVVGEKGGRTFVANIGVFLEASKSVSWWQWSRNSWDITMRSMGDEHWPSLLLAVGGCVVTVLVPGPMSFFSCVATAAASFLAIKFSTSWIVLMFVGALCHCSENQLPKSICGPWNLCRLCYQSMIMTGLLYKANAALTRDR